MSKLVNSDTCPYPTAGYTPSKRALGIENIGHIHIKDALVDMPKATVEFCELGAGDMAGCLSPLAEKLNADGYNGHISLESVYRPDGGDFESGFKASVGLFKELYT